MCCVMTRDTLKETCWCYQKVILRVMHCNTSMATCWETSMAICWATMKQTLKETCWCFLLLPPPSFLPSPPSSLTLALYPLDSSLPSPSLPLPSSPASPSSFPPSLLPFSSSPFSSSLPPPSLSLRGQARPPPALHPFPASYRALLRPGQLPFRGKSRRVCEGAAPPRLQTQESFPYSTAQEAEGRSLSTSTVGNCSSVPPSTAAGA